MPIPTDPMGLIDPPNPNFTDIDGWEMEFARYQWFYVPGYRRLMNDAGIYDISDVKSFIDQTLATVPARWKTAIPNGDWNNLADNQIKRAVENKTLRLEKALLAIICLYLAAKSNKATRALDIFDINQPITIRPAIFLLDGFNENFYLNNINTNVSIIELLRKASAQKKEQVFEYMAKGYSVTSRTASKTCELLASIFPNTHPQWDSKRVNFIDRRVRRDRKDKPLRKRPNEYETITYP